MNRLREDVPVCPYCARPLRCVANRWFGHGVFECEQCGDFPDFRVSVTSAPPVLDAHDEAPVIQPQPPVRPRVLLVDDSAEHRDLYALMLESTATVVTASRGEDALALAYAEPPDAVVLDVMMPGMDGWEVCERLKAHPTTKAVPVIMLTSLDGVDVPARARRTGAIAVLMKPCPAERLILTIDAARRPGGGADAGHEPVA